jgi:hypothetical protein
VEIAGNVYLTRPDNFDQLRALLHRLLTPPRPASWVKSPDSCNLG